MQCWCLQLSSHVAVAVLQSSLCSRDAVCVTEFNADVTLLGANQQRGAVYHWICHVWVLRGSNCRASWYPASTCRRRHKDCVDGGLWSDWAGCCCHCLACVCCSYGFQLHNVRNPSLRSCCHWNCWCWSRSCRSTVLQQGDAAVKTWSKWQWWCWWQGISLSVDCDHFTGVPQKPRWLIGNVVRPSASPEMFAYENLNWQQILCC